MAVALHCERVEDRLEAYHPYTVEYRRPGSTRYEDFSPYNPRDPDAILQYVAQRPARNNRDALADTLRDALQPLDAPAAVLDNVDALRRPDTFAVVTGHQPALFGGPLFLALKLMSAIRLCALLNAKGKGTFVPVYWNGSEDHNRAEFGRATLFDRQHDQVHLALPPDGPQRMAAATPVEAACGLLQEMKKILPDSEFMPDLIADIDAAAQGSLGEMETRLMLRWFGAQGLVVVEPRMLRALAAPVIRMALEKQTLLHQEFRSGWDTMEAMGFPPPLPYHEPERTVVYFVEDGQRFRLRTTPKGQYSLERRDVTMEAEAVYSEIESHPARFSPSAALRPIVQAAVLPVAVYVAGGGELAYHLQLRGAFRQMETPLPLMLPRAAGTILKPSLNKTMRRLQLKTADLIAPGWDWEAIEAEAEARGSEQNEAFDTFRAAADKAFDTLEDDLQDAGIANLNELEREKERFFERMDGLRERYRKQDPTVGEGPKRQYFRLRKFVLPGETYQELSAWTIYFLSLYGKDLLPAMLEQVDPLTEQHHVFLPQ